ncbi:hypothetical protein NEIRO03_0356 [Nematocida sp. AWRm78]|nr:hypothetical protein NEIRO02_0400 [Nematocida sp. AWRm79]KAI5182705.1 hypothetical protein NEIRO03_0356 [Nematocida sp. AWRm78]
MVRLEKVLISAFFIIYIPIYSSSNTPFASVTPEPKIINYYTSKSNVGFLYNIGAKKFIGTDPHKYFIRLVDGASSPMPIEIAISYGNGIGTYVEIIAVDSVSSPNEGKRTSSDFHTNVKRIDTGGGNDGKTCYLYGRTSDWNRFAITPPYYDGDTAFKILKSSNCLGATSDNFLKEMPCVDDTTDGEGTEENDRQLFKFCKTIPSDISEC